MSATGESCDGGSTDDQRQLRDELKELTDLAVQAVEGMAVAGLDGTLRFVNPAWARLHGYDSGEELLGQNLAVFHTSEQLQKEVIPFNKLVREKGSHVGNVGHKRRDGTTFPTEMVVNLLKDPDGVPYGYAGFIQDISQRQAREAALQKSEELYRSFFGNAMVGLFRTRLRDGLILDANEEAARILGRPREEIIGRLRTVDIYRDPKGREELLRHLAEDGEVHSFEARLTLPDGSDVVVAVSAKAYPDEDLMEGAFVDISERKRAEEELAAFNSAMVGREMRISELKQQVNGLCAELGRHAPYRELSEDAVDDVVEPPACAEDSALADVDAASQLSGLTELEHILTSFCESVGIASAIIDLEGTILVRANWQRICTDFHRQNEETCRLCIESDTFLANQLAQTGDYAIYECKNGLTDAAAPIFVNGQHVANAFVGQFYTRHPDEEKLRRRARQFGFDEDAYVHASREVPLISTEKMPAILGFLTSVAEISTSMSLDKERAERAASLLEARRRDIEGQRQAALGLMEDARLAEDELRQLRNYLANIIDSMPSVLVGVDLEGRITQWNKEAQRVTGIPAPRAMGQPLGQAFPLLAAEMERVREAMRTREVRHESRRARTEEGDTWFEDVTVYPLVANGVEGAVIRVDDVTEKVRLEEMMIQSEKMLSIGGLAAGMAHEINNPLAGMIQTAEVVRDRLTSSDIPSNRQAAEDVGTTMAAIQAFMEKRSIPKMLNRICESGCRAAQIVSNMLSFARKTDSVFSSHDMAELLDTSVELAGSDYDLKKKFDFRHIRIVREYGESLPLVACEAAKIQQVFLNILRNGAEAMHEARAAEGAAGSRGAQPSRFVLRLAHEKESGFVRIEIEDNGPGMDAVVRRRVFEPFFTTKTVGAGTGLGLSVSYFIVTENHGGDMTVSSFPGRGTTFTIHLPVERRPQ